jgi:hypothetical protein
MFRTDLWEKDIWTECDCVCVKGMEHRDTYVTHAATKRSHSFGGVRRCSDATNVTKDTINWIAHETGARVTLTDTTERGIRRIIDLWFRVSKSVKVKTDECKTCKCEADKRESEADSRTIRDDVFRKRCRMLIEADSKKIRRSNMEIEAVADDRSSEIEWNNDWGAICTVFKLSGFDCGQWSVEMRTKRDGNWTERVEQIDEISCDSGRFEKEATRRVTETRRSDTKDWQVSPN